MFDYECYNCGFCWQTNIPTRTCLYCHADYVFARTLHLLPMLREGEPVQLELFDDVELP